ncbi:ABC transporter ATP-binding protein [Pantanalinema rosaneae CENA516]|uniref:ABC transporter ATP-binding protein n=1 Tax=Pantanalinema rosaneae TaxID=1620701 RepID=UPI003D6FF1A6
MVAHRVSIWHLLWQLIRYAQPLYWTDTLLWLLIAGLPALPGLVIREFFNTLTDQSGLTLSSGGWIALFLAIGVARIVAIFTGRITKTQHRFTMSALIRRNLLATLLDRPGAEPFVVAGQPEHTLSPGEVISFFREDATQIEDNVVGTNEILGEGIFAIGSLLLLFSVNASITLFVFLPLAIIATLIHRIADRIKRYRRASRQATQRLTGLIGEIFTAVQAIQVAGAEPSVLKHFRHLCDRRRQSIVQDQLLTTLLESSFENLVSLGTGAILFFAAQSMRSQVGNLTVGDFALFVYYLSYVTYFLSFLGGFLALSKQSEVSFERMQGLLGCDAPAIVAHHPLHLPTLTGRTPPLPPLPQAQPVEPLEELVALNLTYHYPGSDRGITDVSLRLKRGSVTVITGAIGAGKTTLLQGLMGLLPLQSGEIYWNGQRIEHPAQFFIPPRSAYTPQVPQLFSHTLRENILLGIDRDEPELQHAIALATFDQDLAAMPDGLETLIGSKGMRLSGGQLQRVAAARMFIRQPELLIFDDLSSALDTTTEQTLWSRLFALSTSRTWNPTFLVVSHRPTVLQQADRIILLNHGKVELEGTFADLPAAYKR